MTWRERLRRVLPYVVTAAAGFAIGYLFMFLFVFKPSVVPNTERVPDVVGMEYDLARERLASAGFDAEMGTMRVDPIVAKGSVIEQSPNAGAELESGGRVVLTVSAGRPTVNPAAVDSPPAP